MVYVCVCSLLCILKYYILIERCASRNVILMRNRVFKVVLRVQVSYEYYYEIKVCRLDAPKKTHKIRGLELY